MNPILVTGATGHLGTAVCKALIAAGLEVRATDRRYVPGFPAKVELGDLGDEHFAYRVVEGCGAVVHLANHANAFAGPSAQRLLTENVGMNANVFYASVDLGIRCLVFSSSVQVMVRRAGSRGEPPYQVPYLPLDSDAPPDPGSCYAVSKEFGERMLRLLCQEHPELSATALRYPMLPQQGWIRHLSQNRRTSRRWLNFAECLTHLYLADAASLVVRVLAKRAPGYHQYFPATTTQLQGYSAARIIREWYPDAPLRQPIEQIGNLVDISVLERDLDWWPEHRLSVTLEDD